MAWLQVRVRYNGLQSLQTLVPCQVRRGGISNITGMKNKDYTVIVSDPLKNMDIYKKMYNHIIIFDKIFIVCINTGFFISILILLISCT